MHFIKKDERKHNGCAFASTARESDASIPFARIPRKFKI